MSRALAVILFATVACSRADDAAPAPPTSTEASAPAEARVARTATLSLTVTAWEPFEARATEAIRAAGGHLADRTLTHTDGAVSHAHLRARVPPTRLDAVLRALQHDARVLALNERSEDVTRAWVDGEARLANLRSAEARVRDLTADRTAGLADVLTAEQELTRLRGEIEALDAQGRALVDRVELATLDVEIRVEHRFFAETPPLSAEVVAAASDSVQLVARAGRTAVIAVAWLSPPLAILAAIGWATRRLRRLTETRPAM